MTTEFRTVPANTYANTEANHYNIPFVEWFRGDDSPTRSYPGTFTPDIGNTSIVFRSNISTSSIQGTYITDMKDSFWSSLGNKPNGFKVTKPSTPSKVEFNIEISGGKGVWMPCPVFRSMSFYVERETHANSNFYPRTVGLKLRNIVTGETKIWGSGWSNGANPNPTYTVYRFTDLNAAYQLRNVGPDWVIYGVIINWVSNSTQANQAPKLTFSDFRLGWTMDGLTGTTKWVLPQPLTWNNLTSMVAEGQRKFVPEEPILALGEWNWKGHSTNTGLYQMCDNGNQRNAFFKSDWNNIYFDKVDRNGQVDMHNKFEQALGNGDEIWLKVNNQPAMKYTETPMLTYTVYYCSFSISNYGPSLPSQQGVLRWYDQNPDA